jgi:hypothetical protein
MFKFLDTLTDLLCIHSSKNYDVLSEHSDLKLTELLVNHCCYHVADYLRSMYLLVLCKVNNSQTRICTHRM